MPVLESTVSELQNLQNPTYTFKDQATQTMGDKNDWSFGSLYV